MIFRWIKDINEMLNAGRNGPFISANLTGVADASHSAPTSGTHKHTHTHSHTSTHTHQLVTRKHTHSPNRLPECCCQWHNFHPSAEPFTVTGFTVPSI